MQSIARKLPTLLTLPRIVARVVVLVGACGWIGTTLAAEPVPSTIVGKALRLPAVSASDEEADAAAPLAPEPLDLGIVQAAAQLPSETGDENELGPETVPPVKQEDAPAPVPAPVRVIHGYTTYEGLAWWVQGTHLPPIVTTSPRGTHQGSAGVLGDPETRTLFGDQDFGGGFAGGFRLFGGIWLNEAKTVAFDYSAFILGGATSTYTIASNFDDDHSDPILARPYYDATPGENHQASELVAYPNYRINFNYVNLDGSVKAQQSTNPIASLAIGGRFCFGPQDGEYRRSFLVAYRLFGLREMLSIESATTIDDSSLVDKVQMVDKFYTDNIFNGGEIGLLTERVSDRWSLLTVVRLAMGSVHQEVATRGWTNVRDGGSARMYSGGLLTQPSNLGDYSRYRFALMPSLDVKLGYRVNQIIRFTVGYNFTYVTSVVRGGDQIDLRINTDQFPLHGPAQPAPLIADTGIWLQGVTAGVDLHY